MTTTIEIAAVPLSTTRSPAAAPERVMPRAGGSAKVRALPQIGGRRRKLFIALAVIVGCVVLVVPFGNVLSKLDYREMVMALRGMHMASLVLSVGATALSLAALVARDACALRYVAAKASPSAIVLAGLCGSALGNSAGLGALTAAAVRYRIYGAIGVKTEDIARLLLFILGGFALGLASVGGIATLSEADPVAAMIGWSATPLRIASSATLASVVCLFVFGLRGEARIGGVTIAAPTRMAAAMQLGLTSIRLFGAAIALWVLLPPAQVSFSAFVAIFSAATALGAVSHLPGGVGVFELIVLWAFRGRISSDSVAAGLVVYRGVYYALPLILSSMLFAAFELRSALGRPLTSADDRLAQAAARLTPTFVSALAFGTGAMLLVSGATPTFGGRLAELSQHVPLWVVETSSFLGSVIGVVFLFVARGLIDRRDGAWRLALALSLSSLVFSLFKGLVFGEAAFLVFFSGLLLATRQQFNRPTSMFDQPFTWGWINAVGAILVASFGILWLAFHNVQSGLYGLWWQFEFDAQAPRALRAVLGASVAAVALGLRQLLRAPAGSAQSPTALELEQAGTIIEAHPRGDAMMVHMGDKSLLFSSSARAFLMFGKRGRSWIALFDPIGPREDWRELIDRFITVSRDHGGRVSFYQVRPESLPIYLDAGFTAMKLGEEAIVDLPGFHLKGGASSHLRYALKRGERDGLQFELLCPEQTPSRLDDLADVSGQWMDARRGEDKGFSVASFDRNYLSRQHVGIVTEKGRPVAFASVMTTASGVEATVGLMRSATPNSPVAMEFLLTRLMLALRELGYARFSLGVVPLAGLRAAPLSSGWHRIAALIWKHGDRFYNFQGLRTFKNKFRPRWEPRYFVAAGALGPFVALADAAALISAGSGRLRENLDA
jgi:phosphatidylglycerol lysyltransferase